MALQRCPHSHLQTCAYVKAKGTLYVIKSLEMRLARIKQVGPA